MFLTGFTLFCLLLVFALLITLSLCTIFHAISLNINGVLSINPTAKVFVFGDFNIHLKDWLTYSSEGTSSDYSRTDWNGLHDHLKHVPWKDVFKLSASAATKFYQWVQVGIDVYINHLKRKVKSHSSPWFPAADAVVTAYRYHFFHLYPHNKSAAFNV